MRYGNEFSSVFCGCCFCILVLENLILQLGVFVSFDRVEVKKLLAANPRNHTDFPNPIPNSLITTFRVFQALCYF